MAEERLKAELEEAKAEVQRLKDSVTVGTPMLHKDLSLITLVPKWTGSDSVVTLEEFISSIESSARLGRWEEKDQVEIAVLKLAGSAKTFYKGCPELHADGLTWQQLKTALRNRYKDVHVDQYHYMKLQTARQAKNEDPQAFADRCRELAQKIVCKVNDPVAQRIHNENAERMLLASFVSGLVGSPGLQCRYASPQSMEHALRIALAVQEAERQEKISESFYANFDRSVRLTSKSPSRTHPDDEKRSSTDTRAVGNARSQRQKSSSSANRSANPSTRSSRTKAALRCYECQGVGHFGRECPTRLKREATISHSPGKRSPTERSRR